MSLAEACEAEVRALHDFFEDWFTAERPRTADEIARLEDALGSDFALLGPEGEITSRSAITSSVEQRHGAAATDEAPDEIDIEAVETRFERERVCLMSYEEHQHTAGTWRGRRSSALFERTEAAPGGVVGRHLHETWLPE